MKVKERVIIISSPSRLSPRSAVAQGAYTSSAGLARAKSDQARPGRGLSARNRGALIRRVPGVPAAAPLAGVRSGRLLLGLPGLFEFHRAQIA